LNDLFSWEATVKHRIILYSLIVIITFSLIWVNTYLTVLSEPPAQANATQQRQTIEVLLQTRFALTDAVKITTSTVATQRAGTIQPVTATPRSAASMGAQTSQPMTATARFAASLEAQYQRAMTATQVAIEAVERQGVRLLRVGSPRVFTSYRLPVAWTPRISTKARYLVVITGSETIIERCRYRGALGLGAAALIRAQISARITIFDLASDDIIATKSFSGSMPRACGRYESFSGGDKKVTGEFPSVFEFEPWLKVEMAKRGYK
jgi:hypothetical protein